ncbi:hypothetical protein SCOR_24460 [Sulfidibacter corallicola]|uniref:Uncharacterized protein n=1 Tax=Sulfidibacter corallicola TaxID=2818388 RepID=A0A8A4TTL2_SULCO|nr:hypothetical protein [Sulfidibacter corallicola]QTD52438.1 hypothetical protein J3U87_08190 [Sulfidibacter corallicola]
MDWSDLEKVRARPVDTRHLEEVIGALQSEYSRHSTPYKQTILGLIQEINGYQRGVLSKIDILELRDQIGHLLYYKIKNLPIELPYDVEYLPMLQSHFKNPTVIVLRRIRRFLMAPHRRVLTKMEEEQARERHLRLENLDINRRLRAALEEMQRYQTMARLTKAVTRKLDILTKALHLPAAAHSEFRILDNMLTDRHHLRHHEATDWVGRSPFRGNQKVMRKVVADGLNVLDEKSQEIFATMEGLTGISFDRDVAHMDVHVSWYALGTPQKRGEDFVKIFDTDERVEHKLKRLTYFMIRSGWDVARYRDTFENLFPSKRDLQENVGKLALLFFDIEEKIAESNRPDGEVANAIENDRDMGLLSDAEARDARAWVAENKTRLQGLKLEIFQTMIELKAKYGELELPEELQAQLDETVSDDTWGTTPEGVPRITLMDLHREVESLGADSGASDEELLARWLALHGKIGERLKEMANMRFHRRLRAECTDFSEYESKLLEFGKAEDRLQDMRVTCEKKIIDCYRNVSYPDVDPELLQSVLELIIDDMLMKLKKLDFESIRADRYADLIDQALAMSPDHGLHALDQLLHEMHAIPRQEQLIQALGDWESTLPREEFERKQTFIFENDMRLQKLVDDVRAELRERMADIDIRTRRLRFEVFSLADCYTENLRTVLQALLRMAPKVTSEQEGERLIDNIQAIEAQVIEAQRITCKGGEADDRLRELERAKLLPPAVLAELRGDLEENFGGLDDLLGEANRALVRVRELQNRFGGSYETRQFEVTINIHDLDRLKAIYHFVENITMMDIKRFGVVYQHKNTLMADLYERAVKNDPEVPPKITKQINRRTHKQFLENRHVPLALKIDILRDVPEILESECELLIRTLNFVNNTRIREKSIYKAILQIMAQVKGANVEKLRGLRRVWLRMRNRLNAHKPRNFSKNYQNNVRSLFTDVNEIVGHRFEDL